MQETQRIGQLEGYIEASLNPLDLAMLAVNESDLPLAKNQLRYAINILKRSLSHEYE